MKKHKEPESLGAHAERLAPLETAGGFWKGVVAEGKGGRADKYLAETVRLMSRSQLKARGARIRVDGAEEKLSRRLKPGEKIEVGWSPEPEHSFQPEKLEVRLIYEDANIFVFDKAQGMVTHPANGHWGGTLANAALWLDAERKGEGDSPRGGIVHRLDKDTSGVIVVARNTAAHEYLAGQFKDRTVRKEYAAIVRGLPSGDAGRMENYLARDRKDRKKFAASERGGKHAVTDYKVLKRWNLGNKGSYAFLALYPKTGRTHQLRVHLSELGCPILGDPLYGKQDKLFPDATLMLHARRLKICLPGAKEPSVFKADLPQRFRDAMASLDAYLEK
ncbi:MAG: RluA family pseudouridine synthase [Spirochaetes bacterium]|nr:RluA family pseudouridine synthase [Spirochaetota bacterium]